MSTFIRVNIILIIIIVILITPRGVLGIGQVLPGAREVERWVTHLFLPPGEIQECNIKRRKKLFSTNEKAKGPESAVIGDAHL